MQSTVAQVAGDQLTANNSKTVTPGAIVYFPHTVTNTGNGSDSYALAATGNTSGGYNFSSVTVYPDAGCTGTPSSTTPITATPTLAPGQSYCVVVAALVPASATSGQTESLAITSKSAFNPALPVMTDTDTATVTSNAVINVTKAETVTSGPAGTTPITITLTYTNTGNTAATTVALTDALPAGMAYLPGTGRWSVSGTTGLNDNGTGNPAGITFSEASNTVTATIASIGTGVSGNVSFQAGIATGATPGNLPIRHRSPTTTAAERPSTGSPTR